MTAPLKTVEADTAAVMPEIGRRARRTARALALAPDGAEGQGARRHRRDDPPRARPTSSPPMPRTWRRPKRDGANAAFLDRLALDDKRVAAMAAGVEVIRDLADPVGAGHRALDAARTA